LWSFPVYQASVTSHVAYELTGVKSENKRRATVDLSLDGQVLLISLGLSIVGYILPPLQTAQSASQKKMKGIKEDREVVHSILIIFRSGIFKLSVHS